jgi:hypothetical protein
MKRENEKLATSLANQFRAGNEKLRQELSLEVQTEIHNRKKKEMELLRKDTEIRLGKMNENFVCRSDALCCVPLAWFRRNSLWSI